MYILSLLYDKDIECVKRLLKRENIYLDDIKNICYKTKNDRLTSNPLIEGLRISYENIVFLCSEMEFLGMLYDKGIASDLILKYYGRIIVETYAKLHPLLRRPDKNVNLFPYYTKIYKDAKLRILALDFYENLIIKLSIKSSNFMVLLR